MASASEVGHAKNIANLKLLNDHIVQLGAQYNPSNMKLKLNNLQALYTEAHESQELVSQKTGPYTIAVDARQAEFKALNPNLTGLRKAYKATDGVTAGHLEDLMTIIRKIKGVRSPGSSAAVTQNGDSHSASQMSYDQRTNQMDVLISQLESTANFAPNEEQYQIATYTTKKASMLASTQAVNSTAIPLNSARDARNVILYQGTDNLVELAGKAKNYLLSILPVGSVKYKAISRIKFREIKT